MRNFLYVALVFVTGSVSVLCSVASVASVMVLLTTELDRINLLLFAVGFAGCGIVGMWLVSLMTPDIFGVKQPRKPRRKPRK